MQVLQLGNAYGTLNPGEEHFTIEELRAAVEMRNATVTQKILHCRHFLRGSPQYWFATKCNLSAMITQLGHTFRFTACRCHSHLHTALRQQACHGLASHRRNPVVVRVIPFLLTARDGSRFEEYCFQCLVLHKPFRSWGDILEVYSSAIRAASAFFDDQNSAADLDDAVREAVIELANEVPVAESDRVVLPVSNAFDTGPLVAPPVSVSVAPSLLLSIMIGPRAVFGTVIAHHSAGKPEPLRFP